MGFVIALAAIIQNMAVSLGVGGSTIAVLNYFKALADDVIEDSERNFMDITYWVLRVAMVLILLSALVLGYQDYVQSGFSYFTPFVVATWSILIILYLNAFLMSTHSITSALGPAVQAASWYTLGTIYALVPLGLAGFTYLQFFVGYLASMLFAISLINGVMAHLKSKHS